MNVACESDVRVQNELAVRCSLATKPPFVIEYIKAISTLVGASHILAVFEENDAIKVFFDDKRHVETLIRNCLHVMGHHVRVDYVVPPGTKLILSNVDPVISDYDIMRLLSGYGSIVSPVFRPPISVELELCHIGYGVRYVYMELNGCVPERIEFKYGNELCYLKIQIDERSAILMLPDIKTDTVEGNRDEVESNSTVHSLDIIPGPSGVVCVPNLESVDPILVSVQSISENNSKEEIPFLTQQSPTMKVSSSELSISSNRTETSTVKRLRGRPSVSKRKDITAVSKAAKRIKRSVKHKWIKRRYKKGKCHRKAIINSTSLSLRNVRLVRSSTSSSCSSTLPDITTLIEQKDSNVHDIVDVLDEKQLQTYLEEVKHHRAPLALAKVYIGEDCDSNKINKFIDQLNDYKRRKDVALKNRISRLIKSITDALSSED